MQIPERNRQRQRAGGPAREGNGGPLTETAPDAPLNLVVVVREGGGTTGAELLAAERLAERGHRVQLIGSSVVAGPAKVTGLPFDPLSRLPELDGADLLPRLVAASERWTDEVAGLIGAETDAVVVDSLVFAGSIAAEAQGVPSCALVPTVLPRAGSGQSKGRSYASRSEWRDDSLETINRVRGRFGLADVGSLAEQIFGADRVLMLTSRAFELPDLRPPPSARYVGPLLRENDGESWQPPWPANRPLVAVTLGTTDQGQAPILERAHEAVSQLGANAVVTTGGLIDPSTFAPSPGIVVERHLPLTRVIPHASVMVTHGGHGSVMTALRRGVPVVCIPLGRDQPDVVARVEHHGLGVGLSKDADAGAIGEAIEHVLGGPFTERARAIARALAAEPRNLLEAEVESAALARTAK